jgi:hypothetical protein
MNCVIDNFADVINFHYKHFLCQRSKAQKCFDEKNIVELRDAVSEFVGVAWVVAYNKLPRKIMMSEKTGSFQTVGTQNSILCGSVKDILVYDEERAIVLEGVVKDGFFRNIEEQELYKLRKSAINFLQSFEDELEVRFTEVD